MQGGVKVYRGAAAAARHYVEADHSRVDDYYLAEGTGLAQRFVASPEAGVQSVGVLDGDGYEAWVAGLDPDTGEPHGRLRKDANAVRFVEVVVNGPKSWSLAAALHPEVADAYDAAMDRAATQIISWLAQHATTRVGPRGRQVQVPVELIEAVTVRHYTSRTGDPHRHLHLQVNARVFAAGKWRGLHTVGVRDSIDAVNGIGHAAIMTDPVFRATLAGLGFTLEAATGEIDQLRGFVGPFSARARQIASNIKRHETTWRDTHPGEEPGPKLHRAWDARAWAQARPDKVIPSDGHVLTDRWVGELRDLGYHDPAPAAVPDLSPLLPRVGVKSGQMDRDAAVKVVLSRLGARRSGWNAADIRGEAERLIARTDVVAPAAARLELAEDLTARALAGCVALIDVAGVPEHIRAWTSPQVLAVEDDLTTRLTTRAHNLTDAFTPPYPIHTVAGLDPGLDPGQTRVVATLAGSGPLVVVEGAAGAGKTTTLAAARAAVELTGHRMVVVTPTLKAARVAAHQVGADASSAAAFAYRHGFRWDEDGNWTRVHPHPPAHPTATGPPGEQGEQGDPVLGSGDLLLVDEAGMLDQDTAAALLTIADETGARVAFLGDTHQLPAVGRGGVLDLAARWAAPGTHLTLDTVHRFTDPTYADLTLAMRTATDPATVFDQLLERDQVVLHDSEHTRTSALAEEAAETGALVVADTREQVADLNAAIRNRLVATGGVSDTRVLTTRLGERIGVGDRVATRRNDYDLGVANRDTWTVTGIEFGGLLITLTGTQGERTVPGGYAREHVELAYATTAYGAQGDTVHAAHLVLGEHTGAASAYVAMTRGRHTNTVHIVADTLAEARKQWVDTFARDRADLGPAVAAEAAAHEAAKYVTDPATAARLRYARLLAATPRRRPGTPKGPVPHPPDPSPYERYPRRTGPGIGF